MKQGRHAQAADRLEEALDSQNENYQIHRVLGICRMNQGRLQQAESHLRKAVELMPSSPAARYFLAQVLALRGGLAEAQDLLTSVVSDSPNSSYARRAQAVLPGLQQLEQSLLVKKPGDYPWSLYVRVSGEYDDNILARSRHEPDSDTASWRMVTSSYLSLKLLDQQRNAPWPTLEAGYAFYRSFHDEAAFRDYDVQSHTGRLNLQHRSTLAGRMAGLGFSGYASNTEIGKQPFSDTAGVEITPSLALTSFWLAELSYAMHWKSFEDDSDFPELFSRDGDEQEVGLQNYLWLFNQKLILGLAYKYGWNKVEGSQFELDRHRVSASATLSLPAKFRLYSSVDWASEDYGDFTPDPRREDDAVTAYASLSRPLWSDAWRAEVHGTWSSTDSTRDFAEYERTVWGAALSWSP